MNILVAGRATGFHCHNEIAKGKFVKCYHLNQYGVYQLYNSISPDKAYVIDGCTVYYDGQPLSGGHEMHWKTSNQIPGVDKVVAPKNPQPVGGTTGPGKAPAPEAPKTFTGWIGKDGKWQYKDSNGNLVTSKWIEDKKVWYYIKSNSYMAQSEWCELVWNGAKQWFYFGKSGRMMASCWYEIDGEWYYSNVNGVALKNSWVATDGEWYWVDSKCKMVKGCTIDIEGNQHSFDAKGRWMRPIKDDHEQGSALEAETDSVVNGPESQDPDRLYYGCDISWHNGVDFDVTKYDFVIIRAAYGTNEDTLFEANVKKCEEAGIPWGVYTYSYALDSEDAVAEADYVVELLKGRKPALGVWFDYEDADGYKAKNKALTKENSQKICEAFFHRMDEISDLYTGIYCNPDYLNRFVDNNGKWDQWLAHWTGEPNKKGTCVMHQYKVEEGLDYNVSYVPLEYYSTKK